MGLFGVVMHVMLYWGKILLLISSCIKKKFFVFVATRIPYFETSAATGVEVDKAVITLLDLVMKRMEQCVDKPPADAASGNGATKLSDAQPNEKKCAC